MWTPPPDCTRVRYPAAETSFDGHFTARRKGMFMRVDKSNGGLKVYAVAGTYVVTFGINLPEADCGGLLGFSIHRVDHAANVARYLQGMKCFAETDPGFPAG